MEIYFSRLQPALIDYEPYNRINIVLDVDAAAGRFPTIFQRTTASDRRDTFLNYRTFQRTFRTCDSVSPRRTIKSGCYITLRLSFPRHTTRKSDDKEKENEARARPRNGCERIFRRLLNFRNRSNSINSASRSIYRRFSAVGTRARTTLFSLDSSGRARLQGSNSVVMRQKQLVNILLRRSESIVKRLPPARQSKPPIIPLALHNSRRDVHF